MRLRARAYRANSFKLDRINVLHKKNDDLVVGEASRLEVPASPTPKRKWGGLLMVDAVDGSRIQPPPSPIFTGLSGKVSTMGKSVSRARDQPSVPAFLQQSALDIQRKFERIQLDEQKRVNEGVRNAASPFASPTAKQTRMFNRYMNVQPYNGNRVKLKIAGEGNDYINASPIVLESPTTGQDSRFIAMQGPKQNSVNHVWRMLWDECEAQGVVIMLTETHEAGMEKCYEYFPRSPKSGSLQLHGSDIQPGDEWRGTATCIEKYVTGHNNSIEVRKIVLAIEGQGTKTIWHLLYTKWPDFGVPLGEDVKGFFETMKLSRTLSQGSGSPRIVHCSAGVGRSGTFISLDYLMAELEAGGLEGKGLEKQAADPVFDVVCKLRSQRCLMVQAEPQYAFLYLQLKRLWEIKYHSANPESKSFKTNDAGNKVFD